MMAVIAGKTTGMHFFKRSVGIGSRAHVLAGDLIIMVSISSEVTCLNWSRGESRVGAVGDGGEGALKANDERSSHIVDTLFLKNVLTMDFKPRCPPKSFHLFSDDLPMCNVFIIPASIGSNADYFRLYWCMFVQCLEHNGVETLYSSIRINTATLGSFRLDVNEDM